MGETVGEGSDGHLTQPSKDQCRTALLHPATQEYINTHTHTSTQAHTDMPLKVIHQTIFQKRPHTHSGGETNHPPFTTSDKVQQHAHNHSHALGVLGPVTARSESEELTSPTNTVHPARVCVCV